MLNLTWRTFQIFFIISSALGAGKGKRSPRRKGACFLFGNREGRRVCEDGRRGGAPRQSEGVRGGTFYSLSGWKWPRS